MDLGQAVAAVCDHVGIEPRDAMAVFSALAMGPRTREEICRLCRMVCAKASGPFNGNLKDGEVTGCEYTLTGRTIERLAEGWSRATME